MQNFRTSKKIIFKRSLIIILGIGGSVSSFLLIYSNNWFLNILFLIMGYFAGHYFAFILWHPKTLIPAAIGYITSLFLESIYPKTMYGFWSIFIGVILSFYLITDLYKLKGMDFWEE